MSTLLTKSLIVAVAAIGVLAGPGPVAAQNRNDVHQVRNACDGRTGLCFHRDTPRNWGNRSYRDVRRYDRGDYRRYDRGDYRRYGRYYGHDNGDDALAAGILGFGAGALLGGAVAGGWAGGGYGGGYNVTDHVNRCAARYRSYDPPSDTYLGYDGYRHRCQY